MELGFFSFVYAESLSQVNRKNLVLEKELASTKVHSPPSLAIHCLLGFSHFLS